LSAAGGLADLNGAVAMSCTTAKPLMNARWKASNSVGCLTICGGRRMSGRARPWPVEAAVIAKKAAPTSGLPIIQKTPRCEPTRLAKLALVRLLLATLLATLAGLLMLLARLLIAAALLTWLVALLVLLVLVILVRVAHRISFHEYAGPMDGRSLRSWPPPKRKISLPLIFTG
jgi:hypothetical protein